MTPRRTAEKRIAERSAKARPNDYGAGADAIWIGSPRISGFRGRAVKRVRPSSRTQQRAQGTASTAPFAGGRSRRAMFSNGSRAGGSSGGRRFRALAFSTCSFGAQRTQRHCRIHRGNLSIEAERLRLSSEQTGVKDALKCAVSPTKLSRTFWPNPGSGSTPMIGLRPRSLEKSPSGAANPERSRARAGPPSLMRQFQSRLRGSQRLQQSLNFTSYGMTRKGGALRGSQCH
jgi:hypothetical protein